MTLAFSHPYLLPLALLALLPWLRSDKKALGYSWNGLIPRDLLSRIVEALLRTAASIAVAALVFAMAGPYTPEHEAERIGTGAQIILLLDRSSSMNENFVGRYFGGRAGESKAMVARRLLTDFVTRSRHNLFGMVSFSTAPIYMLPLTGDKEAVLATIRGAESRGRGVTNIAPGLAMALSYFDDQPVTGSRVILLVSDGAARIDVETQDELTRRFQRNQAMLYWLFLRNPSSASLFERPENPNETTTPEYFLHRFFQEMEIPYRAYEAENPGALEKALADIEELENKPLHYREKIPRRDLAGPFYGLALMALLFLLPARLMEVESWHA